MLKPNSLRDAETELIDAMDAVLFDGDQNVQRAFQAYIAWRCEVAKEAVQRLRAAVAENPGLLGEGS